MQQHQKEHLIASAVNPKHQTIVILAEYDETKLRILLDSGATGNHIKPELVQKLRIKQHKTNY
jgi:hypothetical protein